MSRPRPSGKRFSIASSQGVVWDASTYPRTDKSIWRQQVLVSISGRFEPQRRREKTYSRLDRIFL